MKERLFLVITAQGPNWSIKYLDRHSVKQILSGLHQARLAGSIIFLPVSLSIHSSVTKLANTIFKKNERTEFDTIWHSWNSARACNDHLWGVRRPKIKVIQGWSYIWRPVRGIIFYPPPANLQHSRKENKDCDTLYFIFRQKLKLPWRLVKVIVAYWL